MVLVKGRVKISANLKYKTMGKFIALTGSNGQYYFNLLASNGRTILSSGGYATNEERNDGIHVVQDHAYEHLRFERKISKSGEYYFVLKNMEGEIMGTSEMYISEASRENGIEAVKNNARDAEIELA